MKNIPHSNFDYTKFIEASKKESQCESFCKFIDEKIQEHRLKYDIGKGHQFNRDKIAKMIGIETSTLTKIINGGQATRKRDVIIALCFALQLSESETEQAMRLYPMAPLNPYNLRDLVIIHALRDRVSIKQLNDILLDHNYPKLNVVRGDKKSDVNAFYYPYNSTAYIEESKKIEPYCVGGDYFMLSLNERYRPYLYDYRSEMIIRKKGEECKKYRLSIDGNYYEICFQDGKEWSILYSDYLTFLEEIKKTEYSEFLDEFAKLKEYQDQKARYVSDICADTRNYISRFNVINDKGKLVLYGEMFCFDAPELCEYYQIELSNESCIFSISNESRFMVRYLGEEDWLKLYGKQLSPLIKSFTSDEEIDNPMWKSYYNKLLKEAKVLLTQLQERKLFLVNAYAVLEIDDIMKHYKVEKAFDCVSPENMPYDIIPRKECFIDPDGNPITVDDLYRAAELDIQTIEDICDIRKRYGSLEGFLNIDMLSDINIDNHSHSRFIRV